jgi:hypothetical protein
MNSNNLRIFGILNRLTISFTKLHINGLYVGSARINQLSVGVVESIFLESNTCQMQKKLAKRKAH